MLFFGEAHSTGLRRAPVRPGARASLRTPSRLPPLSQPVAPPCASPLVRSREKEGTLTFRFFDWPPSQRRLCLSVFGKPPTRRSRRESVAATFKTAELTRTNEKPKRSAFSPLIPQQALKRGRAVALGPNDAAGEYERGEGEHHKDPDGEHLPINTTTTSAIWVFERDDPLIVAEAAIGMNA